MAATTTKTKHRKGDPRKAKDIKEKKVEWLWEERIPYSMLSVVAGRPDQGKGLFMAHLAAFVTKQGGNVIISAQEDDAALMTVPRLRAAGADPDRVLLWRFRVPDQMEELTAHVKNAGIKLVVMDPFAAHLGKGISRHSDSVRDATGPLTDLAEETGCAIVVIEHALKKVAKDAHPLSAIGGSSSGLPAAVRMGFIFGTDPDDQDRKLLCCVKSNLRSKPDAISFEVDTEEVGLAGDVPYIVSQGECTFDAKRLLGNSGEPGKVGRKPDKRAEAAEWLTTYLATPNEKGIIEPRKAGILLEDGKQRGMTAKTIRRAADDMGVLRQPPGGGKNCVWMLPPEVLSALGVSDGS